MKLNNYFLFADYYFVTNRRGNRCLIYQQFMYYRTKSSPLSTHWCCADYRKNCKMSCTTRGNIIIRKTNSQHNHLPHYDKINRLKYVSHFNEAIGHVFQFNFIIIIMKMILFFKLNFIYYKFFLFVFVYQIGAQMTDFNF